MTIQYGERMIKKGLKGLDVIELQIRLAGFRGTLPDGDFGPGTELQVISFQREIMGMNNPSGIVDRKTFSAIDEFGKKYPLDFKSLKCPCGVCDGFGQERYKGKYKSGKPKVEMYCRYEYAGIHRMLLWAVRALFFFLPEHRFVITSGYRCGVRNEQTERNSTNHHGKAIDLDVIGMPGEDKRADMDRCDSIRGLLVERSNAQIGWHANNLKSLEPSSIAPTWIHYDVRSYKRNYLADHFFCKNLKELNNKKPIKI